MSPDREMSILIVDDSDFIRNYVKFILESREFNVEVACDGNEAILKCARGNYCVVFSDILMPVKSGISAIKEMRALRPSLYVIAMSGLHVGASLREAADIFNADAVLKKPFGEGEILFALEKATFKTGL